MNELLDKLSGGTLTSDGEADFVADFVTQNPHHFDELLKGLSETNDVIRARTTHALEKISRIYPEWFSQHLKTLISIAETDKVPFVRWHLAMIFANLSYLGKKINNIFHILSYLLDDESAFVKNWAISGLCILGRNYPEYKHEILEKLRPLRNYQSAAIRTRATKALKVLENTYLPLPIGWVKIKRK